MLCVPERSSITRIPEIGRGKRCIRSNFPIAGQPLRARDSNNGTSSACPPTRGLDALRPLSYSRFDLGEICMRYARIIAVLAIQLYPPLFAQSDAVAEGEARQFVTDLVNAELR